MAVLQRLRPALLCCLLTFAWDVLPKPLLVRPHLYPYGPKAGDATLTLSEGAYSNLFPLSTPFKFFDESHSSLVVAMSGYISFSDHIKDDDDEYYLPDDAVTIAAFWDLNIDTSVNSGRVYYRDSVESGLLGRATTDVRLAFTELTQFSAAYVFIATWHQVTFDEGDADSRVNTFQVVLITDGEYSFVIFNYENITWAYDLHSLGFSSGDGTRHYTLPGTDKVDGRLTLEQTSNVNVPGRWVFRVDATNVQPAGVAEGERIEILDRLSFNLGDFAETLTIRWPSSIFIGQDLTLDFVQFWFNDTGLQSTAVLVAKEVANDGQFTLPVRLPLDPEMRDVTVGALRLSDSSGANVDYRSLRSELHVAEWFLNMYYNQQADNSGVDPTSLLPSVALLAGQRCDAWWLEELENTTTDPGLPACPCTMDQARVDDRFVPDETCSRGLTESLGCPFYHRGATECVRSTFPRSLGGGWQCCYDAVGELLTALVDGGGTFHRSHTDGHHDVGKVPTISHLIDDVLPFYQCCKWSENCAKYAEVRPTDDCRKYVPRRIATGFGDPHIVTLDGFRYTFNRPGEYWLVHTAKLSMQGRATVIKDDQGNPLNATVWSAIVARTNSIGTDTVEIKVNTGDGLIILINGTQQTFGDRPTQEFTGVEVTYNADDATAKVRFRFPEDYSIWVKAKNNTLHFTLFLPGIAVDVTNVALGKPAFQSSISYGGRPSRAVDGDTRVVYSRGGCTHTRPQARPWWFVDLEYDYHVREIVITNRGDCCSERLHDFSVHVSYDKPTDNTPGDSELCAYVAGKFAAGETRRVVCTKNITGRYVTISLPGTSDVLSLCEVQVYTEEALSRGLLGNANDDPDDDLQTPVYVTLPSIATSRQIHEQFGVTWQTTEAESLFTYETGVGHSSFIDLSFAPIYDLSLSSNKDMLPNATSACSGLKECIYDFIATGNSAIAMDSLDAAQSYATIVNSSKLVVNCGYLAPPANGTRNGSSPVVGSVITLSCNEGFRLEGSTERRCNESGNWNGTETTCIAIVCDVLLAPANGSISSTGTLYGVSVTLSCNDDFHLKGSTTRRCTGTWDGNETTCTVTDCQRLDAPLNGTMDTEAYTAGTVVTFSCDKRFSLEGVSSRKCMPSGVWSEDVVTCKIESCEDLAAPTDGSRTEPPNLLIGSSFKFSCDKRFRLEGSTERHCMESGMWDGTDATCTVESCEDLAAPTDGSRTEPPNLLIGSSFKFSCGVRFRLEGSTERHCMDSGMWDGTDATCTAESCEDLAAPTDGSRTEPPNLLIGSSFKFSCGVRFRLEGSTERHCMDSGMWDGTDATCTAESCEDLAAPTDGSRTEPPNLLIGSTFKFSCDERFRLDGSAERHCTESGMWDGTDATCTAESCEDLAAPTDGSRTEPPNLLIGSTFKFSCDERFRLDGSAERHCTESGMWDGTDATCTAESCEDLAAPTDGSRTEPPNLLIASTFKFSCDERFRLEGSTERHCMESGMWDGTDATCTAESCEDLAAPTDGSRTEPPNLSIGSSFKFSCDERFRLEGSSERHCMKSGMWDGTDTTCTAESCEDLAAPTDGSRTEPPNLSIGSSFKFSCDERFRLEGSTERHCMESGMWDGTDATCTVSHCRLLDAPLNGNTASSNSSVGSVVTLTCDTGFILEGSTSRECKPSGLWDGVKTSCVVVSCAWLLVPTYGSKDGDGSTFGDIVTFTCNAGFRLTGSARRTCLASGAWDGIVATCEPTSPSKAFTGLAVSIAVVAVLGLAAVTTSVVVIYKIRASGQRADKLPKNNSKTRLSHRASYGDTVPYGRANVGFTHYT